MIWVTLGVMLVLIGTGMHMASVMAILGYTMAEAFSFFPLLPALGEITWSSNTEFVLVSIPLYILMGEILLRSGMAQDMFSALDKWVAWIPGGLMHTNIAACALFGAASGSSAATAATVGTVAIPNIKRGGYNPSLFLGSLAAGGTLGILIPPSINMVLYGVFAEQSVPTLYIAAMIPGVLLTVLFSAIILGICIVRPAAGGHRHRFSWAERIRSLPHLLPPIILLVVCLATIYVGWATPTESAALGVTAALIMTIQRGTLSVRVMIQSFEGTVKTTSMLLFIVTAAFFVNFVLASIGVNASVMQFMRDLPWSPTVSMLGIIAIYLLLGTFMDELSLTLATVPTIVPAVIALGFDPIWFGIVFTLLIQAAMITPPIGATLFVIQAIRGGGPFRDVVVGSTPFFFMIVLTILLLVAFPDLALWLPAVLKD